jgi:hypothetical protein
MGNGSYAKADVKGAFSDIELSSLLNARTKIDR